MISIKNSFKKTIFATALILSAPAFAEKTLKIGFAGAYPPFSIVDKDGKPQGFDIDIANALCEAMKRKCKIIEIEWDGLIPALKGRKIDMIISSMSATEERRKSIDFSDRYYRAPVRMVRKKGSKIEFNKDGIKGKTIGVQVSTTFDKHLTDLYGDIATINRYNSNDEALLDLQAGRVDIVAAESLVLTDGFLNKDKGKEFELFGPDLVTLGEKYYGEGIAVGLRKNSDKLRKAVNQAIKTIRKNGTYKVINDSYFDFDIYGK